MASTHNQDSEEVSSERIHFLEEIFPAELREIHRRRKSVLDTSIESLEENLEAATEAEEQFHQAAQQAKVEKKKGLYTRGLIHKVIKIPEIEKAENRAEESRKQLEKQSEALKQTPPSSKMGLLGLAFSGGGIRSATFNLGVLQALSKHGILKYVDYLSTVSGGGYIGSCLSSLLSQKSAGTEWQRFPFRFAPGEDDSPATKHLRNHSNYLATGGVIDQLRIPALLVRGILVNFLVILPYLILAVWLMGLGYGDHLRRVAQQVFEWQSFYTITPWAAGILALYIVLFPFIRKSFDWFGADINWKWRNHYERSFGAGLLILLIIAVIETLPTVLLFLTQSWWDNPAADFWTVATAVASLVPYAFADKASGKMSKWTGKLGLMVLGLLGPAILLLIFLRLSYWHIFHPEAYNWPLIFLFAFLLWLYTLYFVNVNLTSLHNFYRDRLSKAYLFRTNPSNIKQRNQSSIKLNDKQKLQHLNTDDTAAPYHLVNATLNLQSSEDEELRGKSADFFLFSKHFCGSHSTGYCATQELQNIDAHLDLGTAMAISGAAAAPNMGTTTIKPLVFIMTLLNIRLGYWLPNPRKVRKSKLKRLPLLGVGPVYLLKELFSKIDENSSYVNVSDGGHIENLAIYELLRRRCKFIIVGDAEADPDLSFGGLAKLIRYARINMGIDIEIELDDVRKHDDDLSRKHCALGEINYGNGETGYLLYIKSSLTGDENEYVKEYHAAHPEYPHESTADQFFDEAQFEVYRALGFHITNELLQQRFFESQQSQPDTVIENWFENLESYLRPRFQMEDEFLKLQQQLSNIERQFSDPDIAQYTYQVYPEIAPAQKSPAQPETISDECFRKIFHLCNLQMQLMESVFIALQLDKLRNRYHHFNRGWMNLFRRWTQAPCFRHAWAVSIGTFSVSFQQFCEDELKLRSMIQWRRVVDQDTELTRRERYLIKKERDQKRLSAETIQVNGTSIEAGQVWQAEMYVWLTPGEAGFGTENEDDTRSREIFPIGIATINLAQHDPNRQGWEEYQAQLMFYRIQDYYRKMRLMNKMIPELRDTLRREYQGLSNFCVDLSRTPDGQRLYGYFFERYGFTVMD